MTMIEFYLGASSDLAFPSVKSEAVPRPGEFVDVNQKRYQVERVTWVIDYPNKGLSERSLRACVEIRKVKP